jgi:hypothetical protein
MNCKMITPDMWGGERCSSTQRRKGEEYMEKGWMNEEGIGKLLKDFVIKMILHSVL